MEEKGEKEIKHPGLDETLKAVRIFLSGYQVAV